MIENNEMNIKRSEYTRSVHNGKNSYHAFKSQCEKSSSGRASKKHRFFNIIPVTSHF